MVSYRDDKVIDIPFPEKFYKSYLAQVNPNNDTFTFIHVRKVLILSIQEFMEGKISLDDVSSIAGALDTENDIQHNTPLKDALESASELAYYVRRIRKDGYHSLEDLMLSVTDFYEKFKEVDK